VIGSAFAAGIIGAACGMGTGTGHRAILAIRGTVATATVPPASTTTAAPTTTEIPTTTTTGPCQNATMPSSSCPSNSPSGAAYIEAARGLLQVFGAGSTTTTSMPVAITMPPQTTTTVCPGPIMPNVVGLNYVLATATIGNDLGGEWSQYVRYEDPYPASATVVSTEPPPGSCISQAPITLVY
jgi:hypothetical protein